MSGLRSACGGIGCLPESFEAGEALALIERGRCSIYYGMPNMARALLEHPDHPKRRLGAMRTGLTIGPPEDIAETKRDGGPGAVLRDRQPLRGNGSIDGIATQVLRQSSRRSSDPAFPTECDCPRSGANGAFFNRAGTGSLGGLGAIR